MNPKLREKLAKAFKEDKTVILGLDAKIPYFVNTGHYALNWALCNNYAGGWPGGKVVELFGDPSTGKSLIMVKAMASMQDGDILVPDDMKKEVNVEDGITILDDTEKAYTEAFCSMLGLQVGDVVQLDESLTVEAHFTRMMDKVKTLRKITRKGPIAVIVDSLSQLSSKHERKAGLDKPDMDRAKKIHAAMRLYAEPLNRQKVLYLVSNHVTEKIGVIFGSNRTVKGGKAVAFEASIRVDLRYKMQFIRNKMETEAGDRGEVYGVKIIANIQKNKVAMPFRWAVMDVFFDQGIDPYSGLYDHFLRQGRIKLLEKAKAKTKKQEAVPALYQYTHQNSGYEFYDGTFDQCVIANDLLEIKEQGKQYLPMIDRSRYINSVEASTGDSTSPENTQTPENVSIAPPPPAAPLQREAKTA